MTADSGGEISTTNLESIGANKPKRGKRKMAQSGPDVARSLVKGISDAFTLAPQRKSVSDWVDQKEDQLKTAYQRATGLAKNALNGPTRYDYSKSKFKVIAKPRAKTVAPAKRVPKRATGKATGY